MGCYLVRDKSNGLYKIGTSEKIKERMSTMGTSNLNLELVFYSNTGLEKYLHQFYSDKKVKKEWYNLTDQDVKNIQELFIDSEINSCF